MFHPALLLVALLALVSRSLAATTGAVLPISVVNYTELPVHVTAVTFDHARLCEKLGLPAGTPIAIHAAGDRRPLPVALGTQDGRPVVRCFVSLKMRSRLELVATRAAGWPRDDWTRAEIDPAAKTGVMRNGVVRVDIGARGWSLGFDTTDFASALLITDARADFWVDKENRGRIQFGDPQELGLQPFSLSTLERVGASRSPEGRPIVTTVRRMRGFADGMTVHESFELVSGLPLMIYRIRWQNDGNHPLWIAYTRSGDGVHGRWAPQLMPGPLVQRKKSPLLGDLNGSETRPSWLGEIMRTSMESLTSGCAVGLSTVLPTPSSVGTGSMIWGVGGNGFQCNFIDPVQGQFPFRVEPHGTLENGFAFLATQTGTNAFRQTLAVWRSLKEGNLPLLASPCAVFIDGEPAGAQSVSDYATIDSATAPLRIDLNRSFEGRFSVQVTGGAGAVEVTARPLQNPGALAPITVARLTSSGEHTVDLNTVLKLKDEVDVVFDVKTSGGAKLNQWILAETLPQPPELLSPISDASVTDLAMMFRWKSLPTVIDYEIQWSRSADFVTTQGKRLTQSDPYPYFIPTDEQLPTPGRWYWRLRAVKGKTLGTWSPTRGFIVSASRPKQPLKRAITAQAPLFTIEATRVLDYTRFKPDIPAELAPYVAVIAEGFESRGLTVSDFARGMKELPYRFMLRSHWVGLADIEWLFQNVPNFVGIQGGEHLSSLYRDGRPQERLYHHRLIRLCAQYGMFYQEADGTYKDDKWQELMDQGGDFVRAYGSHLVLSQKNNIIRRQFYSQSAALGLWLGGVTHHHGAWEDGGFYWQNAGFDGMGVNRGERRGVLKTMPRIFWDLVIVMGLARGCGVYSLDGQTLMFDANEKTPWRSAIWDTSGKTTDTFRRFVMPLMKAIVRHGLVPTMEEVRSNVKLAVYNDRPLPDAKAWPYYAEYGPLFAGTYGFSRMGNIDGQLYEFFPNTGRYHYIPVLVQGDEPISRSIRNLPISQLKDVARVKEIFNAAYPAWYEGDALVNRAGDSLTILNSHENEDVTQTYSVPFGSGDLRSLAGRISVHSYVVAKLAASGRELWLQANTEYPERDSEFVLTSARKPEWQVTPSAALKQAIWDVANGRLTLRVDHKDGAVEVEIK